MVGQSQSVPSALGLDGEPAGEGITVSGRRSVPKNRRKNGPKCGASLSARHPDAKGRAWIEKKKLSMRQKGYDNIAPDSKYTGRKRKSRF